MPHTTDIPVRWGDTDAGGLVYYPRFFHYVVIALNDYFGVDEVGGHLMEYYRQRGFLLPAVDASATFLSPVHSGDRVRVTTTVVECGETSLHVSFTIDGDDARVATGEVAFVFVDRDFEPSPLPDAVHAVVERRGDGEAVDGA